MFTPSEILAKKIEEDISLLDAQLSASYYYSSLPFCITDAVFSIGVKYKSVENTTSYLAKYLGVEKYRKYGSDHIPKEKQISIHEFIDRTESLDDERLSEDIFHNRQRTSTKNGMLKARAVLEFAKILAKHNINHMQDIVSITYKCIETIKLIKGMSSGIAVKYFLMLCGNDEFIKPDRMVLGYGRRNLGDLKITDQEMELIIIDAADILCKKYENITRRKIDHEIWKYERAYRRKSAVD